MRFSERKKYPRLRKILSKIKKEMRFELQGCDLHGIRKWFSTRIHFFDVSIIFFELFTG